MRWSRVISNNAHCRRQGIFWHLSNSGHSRFKLLSQRVSSLSRDVSRHTGNSCNNRFTLDYYTCLVVFTKLGKPAAFSFAVLCIIVYIFFNHEAMGLPWVPEVFLARFPVSVMSLLWPARKTSGAERDFFEGAEPMTSQFKSKKSRIWTRKLIGSQWPPKGFLI